MKGKFVPLATFTQRRRKTIVISKMKTKFCGGKELNRAKKASLSNPLHLSILTPDQASEVSQEETKGFHFTMGPSLLEKKRMKMEAKGKRRPKLKLKTRIKKFPLVQKQNRELSTVSEKNLDLKYSNIKKRNRNATQRIKTRCPKSLTFKLKLQKTKTKRFKQTKKAAILRKRPIQLDHSRPESSTDSRKEKFHLGRDGQNQFKANKALFTITARSRHHEKGRRLGRSLRNSISIYDSSCELQKEFDTIKTGFRTERGSLRKSWQLQRNE
ncbi:unnamed protein product [Moneuplotes crassus]|uniref:Uncharacterized protein n=1 Tax=Euplotes crassus TaxID=5936 RepID=A0AAD1XJ12_EUPCR|nr:unnamed protein product [Moneuplotes crassus]